MTHKKNPLQVLVVDDTAIYRKIISDVLSEIPDVEVVGTANNGLDALEKILLYRPDLLTLDLEMPEMSGLEVLDKLQTTAPDVGAIIISSHSKEGGEMTIKALNRGAFDFILKPDSRTVKENNTIIKDQLQLIIDGFRFCLGNNKSNITECRKTYQEAITEKRQYTSPDNKNKRDSPPEIIAIGVSTGGPKALSTLLSSFPADLSVPVLIAQHMPSSFTTQLAQSLNRKCAINVKEAEDKELLFPGHVYIAPGGKHMKVSRDHLGIKHISLTNEETGSAYVPSINLLFRSVAEHFGGNATGVIMTGMGNDGIHGLKQMKTEGATIIAQDEESCVIFGMPAAAVNAGITDKIVSLSKLADAILSTLKPHQG